MGRSLKKRKIKKVKRVKISRPATVSTQKKTKKKMKKWEWWLLFGALLFAVIWLIFLGKSGALSPSIAPTPTITATESPS